MPNNIFHNRFTNHLLAVILIFTSGSAHAQKFNTDALLNDLLFSGINENRYVGSLQLQAAVRAEQIAVLCGMDEQQSRKLNEAVEGDVARLRQSIIKLRQQARDLPAHLEIMQQQREVQQLASEFKRTTAPEVWLESSLFSRTLNSLATPEQKERLKKHLEEGQASYDRAVVMQTIVAIEQTMLMTDKQREWLFHQLMSTSIPARSNDTIHIIGFQKLARIKPQKLQEVFSLEEIEKLAAIRSVTP